jgi:hypothetical protein
VAEFHIVSQPKNSGPPISWYGWLAVAAIVSLPIALAVPRKWGDRISPTAAWLVAVLIYEKRWFV